MGKRCNIMRKIIALLVVLLLAVPAMAEEGLPVFEWQRDLVNHWKVDKAGEMQAFGTHVLDDELVCSVCGSQVSAWDDGSGDVYDYDAMGNLLRYTGFDETGAKTTESTHALTCNEDGVLLLDLEYVDGVFYGEYVYRADEDGWPVPVRQTCYDADGSVSVNEYDEAGNLVRASVCDAEGALIVEILSEYEMDASGWYYEAKSLTRFTSGESFYSERNSYGDETRSLNKNADGVVWSDTVCEYEYVDGVLRWKKQYSFGVLSLEAEYDDQGNLVKETEYPGDGSYIVYSYDEDGECTEQIFDATGKPIG